MGPQATFTRGPRGDLSWSYGEEVNVSLVLVDEEEQAENTPPTGLPTITGTAQVGQTLMADVSGISDTDGLDNVSYSYQWIRTDTDIQNATESTYTLVDADQGKTIKVRVSFTDDAGNEETQTSAATAEVTAAANTRPRACPPSAARPGGPDPDRRHVGHSRRRRVDQRVLQLPVGVQRWERGHRHRGRDGLDLRSLRRRRGQDHHGAGELHRRPGQPGRPSPVRRRRRLRPAPTPRQRACPPSAARPRRARP